MGVSHTSVVPADRMGASRLFERFGRAVCKADLYLWAVPKKRERVPEAVPKPNLVFGVDVLELNDARERLLFAGLFVIMTGKADLVAGGLQPDAVVSVAARSRRNFYDHFESKEAFVHALFERFLLDESVLVGLGKDDVDETEVTDLRTAVRSWFSPNVLESIEVMGTLAGIVSAPAETGDTLSEILREHNRMFDLHYGPRYESFLQAWDMALTPGWTPTQVATVVRGVADGFVMRFRPSAGEFTDDHLELLVSTVIGVFATAAIDTTNDNQLSETLPMTSLVDRMGSRLLSGPTAITTIDARQALRAAFLEELTLVSTDEINLPFLAKRAGIATSTALRVSGSVKELAATVFHDFATSFESALEESKSDSVQHQVAAHLRRLGRFGFNYAPLIRCWLGFLPVGSPEENDPIDRLVNMFGQLLEEAPGPLVLGALKTGELDSFQLARTITLTFLIPENQASSPVRSDFTEEVEESDRKAAMVLKLCFVEPEDGWDSVI